MILRPGVVFTFAGVSTPKPPQNRPQEHPQLFSQNAALEWHLIVTGAVLKTLAVLVALGVIAYAAHRNHSARAVIHRGGTLTLVVALGCALVSLGFGIYARAT